MDVAAQTTDETQRGHLIQCRLCEKDKPRRGSRSYICSDCGAKGLLQNYSPQVIAETLWLVMGASGVSREIREQADAILQAGRITPDPA